MYHFLCTFAKGDCLRHANGAEPGKAQGMPWRETKVALPMFFIQRCPCRQHASPLVGAANPPCPGSVGTLPKKSYNQQKKIQST